MIRPLALLLSTCALTAQSQFRPTRSAPPPPLGTAYDTTSGDVDGDGDIDLVIGNDHGANQLLLNDGRGRFTDATSGRLTTPLSNATYEVDLVDIDGDGDLDLLLCNDHDLPNRVHVNNGAGVFTDVSATALPPNAFWSVDQVVADFDGDGDVDWLVVDISASMHLYFNNGLGVFRDVTATNLLVGPVGNGYSSIAVDLDADGDLDILLDSSKVLLNQFGAFTLAPAGYLPGARHGTACVGDVDRDGRTDVLLNGGQILLRNLGGGQFQDVSATHLPRGGNPADHMLDADLDGDLDVIGPSLLWLNDGTGRFTAVNTRGPAATGSRFTIADFDGDGDQDFLGRSTTWQIFMNFLRQIDAPNPARIGQGYAVDMYVRHGFAQNVTAVVPALSFGGAVTPLSPLGTLRLDPRWIQVLGVHFALPPAGHVQISYVIPPDPTLVGLQLHHQAVVIESLATAALSNAIVDVIQ